VDVSGSSWVSTMEVHYKVKYENFGGKLLEVVFVAVFLLLDEVLELSLMLAAVKDLFYFLLLFFINEYRQEVFFWFMAWYWIFWGNGQFNYVKDRIKLPY